MDLYPNNPTPGDDLPADPTTEKKLRRSLYIVALAGLIAPCGLCWISTQVEAFEVVLLPSVLGLIVFAYSIYTLYQRQQRQDLAPPLWRVMLVFGILAGAATLTLIWLLRSTDWGSVSPYLILALGIWSLILAGRRVWESWSFSRQGLLKEADWVELDMVSIRGSHPIYPQLNYRYAGEYRGQLRNDRVHRKVAEIREAVEKDRLKVMVKYLPDDPRVHRLEKWWIEKGD
jgi:hypothetical protein